MHNRLIHLATLALATSHCYAAIVNGGFSIPDNATSNSAKSVDDGRIRFYPPSAVRGWSTTDTEIEIWSDGANADARVHNAPSGYKQFAEVNANMAGTLSQTVSNIAVGSKFGFSFYHRGRASATVPDVLKVTVVDPQTKQVLLERDFQATNVAWIRNTVDLGIKKDDHQLLLSFKAVSSASNSLSIGNFLTGIELGEKFLEPPEPIESASAPFSSGLSAQIRGSGDFYSARSTDGSFDLVRRQEGHPQNPEHTIITAVAVRFASANTTIEFYARPERRMLVNGNAMPIPAAAMTLPSGIRITPLSQRRIQLLHEGREVLVIVRPGTAGYSLRYQPEFKYRGGLMINMDGNGATDLTSPEGKLLTLPADAKRIAEFGGTGQVAANEKYLSVPMPPQPVAVSKATPAPTPAPAALGANSSAGAGLFLPDEELKRGAQYTMNGHYLTYQADGNLCVYTNAKVFVWCVNNDKTVRFQESKRVVFTREGVLTMLAGDNQVVWRQPTSAAVPSSKVQISAQGALQIIGPSGNMIWSSAQPGAGLLLSHALVLAPGSAMNVKQKYWAENRQFYAIFQPDGNFGVSTKDDGYKWDIVTKGKLGPGKVGPPLSAKILRLDPDGNLVFVGPDNKYLWGMDKMITPVANSTLNISNSGELLLLAPGGAVLWSSGK